MIALCFIYAFACLIYISRTLLDVLFCVPVIGEGALKINDILKFYSKLLFLGKLLRVITGDFFLGNMMVATECKSG